MHCCVKFLQLLAAHIASNKFYSVVQLIRVTIILCLSSSLFKTITSNLTTADVHSAPFGRQCESPALPSSRQSIFPVFLHIHTPLHLQKVHISIRKNVLFLTLNNCFIYTWLVIKTAVIKDQLNVLKHLCTERTQRMMLT